MLLIEDDSGRAALLDYLRAGYSEHHLVFWTEVMHSYRPLADPLARDALAKEMWLRYGKNGSASQINITEPQRLRVQKDIERIGTTLTTEENAAASGSTGAAAAAASAGDGLFHAPVELFDESAAYCLELIKGNYFFPFQSSKQYQAYKADKQARIAAEQLQRQQAAEKKTSTACAIL
jgi:hypothetical protein